MTTAVFSILILLGVGVDIFYICSEYANKMLRATFLKGVASLFFVLVGIYSFINNPVPFGTLIIIGLALGLVGDVLLNIRNLLEGKKAMMFFAGGILAFLSGHFLYIAYLITRGDTSLLWALLVTAVLSASLIPPLLKQITAPSFGLKIFGIIYLVVVVAMFSFAGMLLIFNGATLTNILFTIGGFLFMASDFILVYYSFGNNVKCLRAVNLSLYYAGQILIALSLFFA